jgi:hypothetical protein
MLPVSIMETSLMAIPNGIGFDFITNNGYNEYHPGIC